MNIIVAADSGNGIGFEGHMLYRLPEDLKFFKEKTVGKVIVMGAATLRSLPGGKPLSGRTNIVLSGSGCVSTDGVTVCRSLPGLLTCLDGYRTDDIFIIGGEGLYSALLPHCDTVYLTRINSVRPADRFFPDIENDAGWRLVSESEPHAGDGVTFSFCTYKRVNEK